MGVRAKSGRKPFVTEIVYIRLSPAEKECLYKMARQEYLSMSGMARKAILESAEHRGIPILDKESAKNEG